jgi:hypothetical protein
LPPVWRIPPEVLLVLILAELLAAADGWDRAPRSVARPRSAPPPRRIAVAGRGALCGRRPRG